MAYFTSKKLEEQWGDDWNDAPYEHNAGNPYADGKGIMYQVCVVSSLVQPKHSFLNSPYFVEQINQKKIPWLRSAEGSKPKVEIWAGTPLAEFRLLIKKVDGEILEEQQK